MLGTPQLGLRRRSWLAGAVMTNVEERHPLPRGIGDRRYYEADYVGRHWTVYNWLISEIVRRSKPGPILDVGCGLGFIVEGATSWGFQCVGLDGSPDAIELARERCPSLDVRVHDLADPLPFPAESFQTVMMYQVIEHLVPSTTPSVLSEIFRVLRPGGVFLVYSPSRYNRHERLADSTHINMLTPSELRAALTAAGFGTIEAIDNPLPLLGRGRVANKVMRAAIRAFPWERIIATANCVATKPMRE